MIGLRSFLVDTKFRLIATGNGCQNTALLPVYKKAGFLRLCVDKDLVYVLYEDEDIPLLAFSKILV